MQSSKTVVKTAEMLSQFDDIATAKLTSSSLAFLESETTAQTAIATFSEVLGAKPCLLYTSPSPRDGLLSRMPSSA